MAESKKGASSAGKPKEKDSMLDLDFGNDDFLTSWKTTSNTGDDGIDFGNDFSPVPKGKNKSFDFKKGDMDFDLSDFGAMPSFDLDISSPVKKDSNSKKKPVAESTTGNNKATADPFSFGFDFDVMGNFSFKSSPKKQDAKEKKDEPKENSLDRSESKESVDQPREENDSHDSEATRNPSNTSDKGQQNSTTVFDKTSAYKELTTFEKTKNVDKQQSERQLDKVSPEEVCIPTEAVQEVSAHSTSAAISSKESMLELQEDVDSGSVVINQGDKQCLDKNETVNTSSSSGSPVHGDQNANGGVPNSVDVHTSARKKDGEKITQIESLVGQSSTSMATKEFTSVEHGQIKSQNLLDHSKASNLIPEKEKEVFTMRSKYFKAADKSGDQLHSALTPRKLSLLSEKKAVVTKQQHQKDERQGNAKENQNDGVIIPDKPLAQLESRVSTEHSDKESQEGSQSLLSSGSMSEDVNKGKLVSRGRESNAKTLDSSRLTVLTEKTRSQKSPNSETSAPKVAITQTKTSHSSVVDLAASLRAKVQTPSLSSLKISRPTGPNTDGSKPLPRDTIKSLNVNQNKVLLGVKPSKADQLAGIIKKQAPPTTPIHSLKRKRVESPTINVISKSPRHLLQSPNTNVISMSPNNNLLLSPVLRHTEENPTDYMDVEANGAGNRKTSTPNSLQSPKLRNSWEANGMELEVPYSMEKDDNVEKAEAISKELDDICNMLRKKHEEAKEVLVRAIVSNNKLLMLNHPMHDEKIQIVQRFAKQLTLK